MGKAAEILYRAADLIEAGSWSRGFVSTDCLCANVAIIKATKQICDSSGTLMIRACGDAQEVLGAYLKFPPKMMTEAGIIMWNDDLGRTKEEVVTTLRGAAASVEKIGG